ncbi:Fe-S cluster assembly transcriptional regulator IscR [Gammaproteobacteria bacterium ESL0073]|nr:Fe-S cluster assembly transcriptional regulator IscR [Gammaproteobacteria bacterium ESL0073]
MRLTTKGRYAVTAMIDLAINATDTPVSLADISERQSISLSYLEQLFSKLRRYNLVKSVRGPGGGYQLSQSAALIDIAQVVDAVNESVDATRCQGGSNGCNAGDVCLTHFLWQDLSNQIHDFLAGITLADLVNKQEVRNVARNQTVRQKIDSKLKMNKIKSSLVE